MKIRYAALGLLVAIAPITAAQARASDLDAFIDGCEVLEKSIQYGENYFKSLQNNLAFAAGRCMSATIVARNTLDGVHDYIHEKWGDKLSWGSPEEVGTAANEVAPLEVSIAKNSCIPEKEKISDIQNKVIGYYYQNKDESQKLYSGNPERFIYHAMQEIYNCPANKQ